MMDEEEIREFLHMNGFDICAMIGKGGFSSCYTVFSQQYQQVFVCKVITVLEQKKELMQKSFQNEINTLVNVIHPNIIQVYQTFSTEKHLYLILEYCPNGDLQSYIMHNGQIKDQALLLKYVSNILDALSYLEEHNIVHKDIKPGNILLDAHWRPKLADFGLSTFISQDKLYNDYCGSLAFCAPEVIKRVPHNPFKSDVWSFGVTLYFLVTGKSPFPLGDRKMLINAILSGTYQIPLEANDVIKKLIINSLLIYPEERMTFFQMKVLVNMEIERLEKEPHKVCLSKFRSVRSALVIAPIIKNPYNHEKNRPRVRAQKSLPTVRE